MVATEHHQNEDTLLSRVRIGRIGQRESGRQTDRKKDTEKRKRETSAAMFSHRDISQHILNFT